MGNLKEFKVLGNMKEEVNVEDFGLDKIKEADNLGFADREVSKNYKLVMINVDHISLIRSTKINGEMHAILVFDENNLIVQRNYEEVKSFI